MSYELQARKYYANNPRLDKAIAAGKQMDNSLKKEYGKEGSTDCHFRMNQYLKYFSYEALKALGA